MVAQQLNNDPRSAAGQNEANRALNAEALEQQQQAFRQQQLEALRSEQHQQNPNLMQPCFNSPTPSMIAMAYGPDDVAEFELSDSPEQVKKRRASSGTC